MLSENDLHRYSRQVIIKEFDEEVLEHNYEKYKETKENLSKIQHDIKLNKSKTEQWKNSLEEVKEHEFDEGCEYCVKNSAWHIDKIKSLTFEIEQNEKKLEKFSICLLPIDPTPTINIFFIT